MATEHYPQPRGMVRLWTLTKDGRTATCNAMAHPLGVEIVAAVDGDVRRTQVVREPRAADGVAVDWRAAFMAKGWQV